ncbi:MAG: hypothetical protein QF473_29470 [Planctomycetota bacterium]|nr:hypothetical protein [Planctomycetota bacterium]
MRNQESGIRNQESRRHQSAARQDDGIEPSAGRQIPSWRPELRILTALKICLPLLLSACIAEDSTAPALTPDQLSAQEKQQKKEREESDDQTAKDPHADLQPVGPSHPGLHYLEQLYKDYDDVRVSAQVDNSRPSIGDWVTCQVTLSGPEGVEFKKAELPQKLPDYVALKQRGSLPQKTEDGKATRTWEFTFDFFFTGKFPLPPIMITFTGKDGKERKLMVPIFFIDIQDLPLDPENAEDIRPNQAMAEIPVSYRKYYVICGSILGAILVIGIAALFFIRWLRKPEVIPPTPAHIIAYEQMRRLIADRLVEEGRFEEFYVRLSDICRHYLENRFGLRAPERTTEEFLAILAGTSVLSPDHKGLVQDFLKHCDQVKFAQYEPGKDEMEGVFESARRLVDETKLDEVEGSEDEDEELAA